MSSQKRSRFGFLHGVFKKKEKGVDRPDQTLNQPSSSSAGGRSTNQASVSTPKQSTTGSILEGLFSRSKTPSTRPTTPTPPTSQPIAAMDRAEQQHLGNEVTDIPSTGKLASKQAEKVPETAAATNEKKQLALELGIGAIDLLTQVSNIAGLALPNPVGEVLGKVTIVLGTLKKMMENEGAWKELVKTLDAHQHDFNEQLGRLKAKELDTDPNSPLLGPIKQYSETLEEILAAIMKEGGLDDKNAPSGDAWKKIQGFCSNFINASSEPGHVQAYTGQLSAAMTKLQSALVLYLGFKVTEMDIKLDGMGGDIRHVYENIVSKEDQSILIKLEPLGAKCGPQVRGCLEGTRRDILEKINTWMRDFDAPNILWLKGHPGVGKSAISSSIVEQLGASKRLGSCFFFQRQAATSMTTSALWRTVAYDLAHQYPTIQKHLLVALKGDETIPTTVDVDKLFHQLIEEPVVASGEIPLESLPVVVIDSLDECGGLDGQHSESRRSLMRTLGSWSRLPGRFKLMVTSRDESDIARVFSKTKHYPIEISAGQRVEAQSSQDIQTFITSQLQELVVDQYEDTLPPGWPGPRIVEDLADKAAGLFIWAQTVTKFISLGEPQQRLNLVLEGSGTSDMNTLYSQILSTAFGHANEGEIDNFRRILGTVILAKEPLAFLSLRLLLSLEAPAVKQICDGLQSIMETKETLRFHHQSFVDFLIDPDRCPQTFLIGPEQERRRLTLACLQTMKRELKFNICLLESSYVRNYDIPDLDSRVKECISAHVSYSCHFWAKHLEETKFDIEIFDHVEYFMASQFLFWLEVLSLTKRVNVASRMLLWLNDWLKAGQRDDAMARDMAKFAAAFSSVISQSASHIYVSALAFSPPNSVVSKQYRPQYPGTLAIETGGLSAWPAIQNVLEGHTGLVHSVAFSPDGRRIISGSADETIRVWDAETGEVVAGPFHGYTHTFSSVAFSPDGRRMASGSRDKTIRVWDAETGAVVAGPFHGHSDSVLCVAFSPDGHRIVSSSFDKTIRVWDAETGEVVVGSFHGHSEPVLSVAFSPDGHRIVSGSQDKTIRVWDVETGAVVTGPLHEHSDSVTSVSFSPDGRRIISGSVDETIRVWDAETGEAVAAPFHGHSKSVLSVAFSPDGRLIVSGSFDETIQVWDAETGTVVAGPFRGHGEGVTSVAFSPDGYRIVSGSSDKTVRLWDAETDAVVEGPFHGHSDTVASVAFSPDGHLIVSGSSDETIQVWDAETGAVVAEPFRGHSDFITSVSFSLDGHRIVSGSSDKTIRVWDTETGALVAGPFHTPTEPTEFPSFSPDPVRSVAFSPDGRRIVSGDDTIRVWDTERGVVIAGPFHGHSTYVTSVSFSPDGCRIVSGSFDDTIRVWDAETGAVVAGPFRGHDEGVASVSFSPDGCQIVSGSSDKTIRVWDAETGALIIGPLRGHSDIVSSVAFSPDGHRIVSGSDDMTIRMWDAETGVMIAGPFHGHSAYVTSVTFSPDGHLIVSGSSDTTIRVWDAMIRDSKYVSPFADSSIIKDGWVLGSNSELLFWIPPSLRDGLFWPRIRLLIGNFITTKLDLSRFVHGESWSKCKG